MNQEKYLQKIGADKAKISPDTASLRFLQRQHLLHVPFENLDIHWEKPIVLNTEKFYRKIVEEKRGGFCYELNGLFYELFNLLGFQSKMLSVRVTKGNGEFGREKDHLAILTRINDEEYFVDVGFGSFIAEPLNFVTDVKQEDATGTYLIKKYDDKYFQIVEKDGENWIDQCIFIAVSYDLSAFDEMCKFYQTSPESHFARKKICSLMTANGRKTLSDDKYIEQ